MTNQVLTKQIITDVAIFTDKPTLHHIQHLKAVGFKYEKGQWSRSVTAAGIHPAEAVTEYKPLAPWE